MSRKYYEMSKYNHLQELSEQIEDLQKEQKELQKIIDSSPEESEMNLEELNAYNEMLKIYDEISEEIYILEKNYADLEEETYEENYADYKYDQWKASKDEED